MAVNKNFVVKNGIEVNDDLLIADSSLGKVGIGSTIPTTTLDVFGQGIKAQDGLYTGILTAISELNVGTGGTVITALENGLIGLGTDNPEYNVHIVNPGSGTTSLYVEGSLTVTDGIGANDITVDNSLTVNNIEINGDANINGDLNASIDSIYTQFDVVNSGTGAYQFNATGIGFTQNTLNPPIYLNRGQNYRFNVNAPGHPFLIKTLPGTGLDNVYPNGVTNNGAQVGIVTFVVPFDAPNTLYYQCQFHQSMVGVMIIDSASNLGVLDGGALVGSASSINFVGFTDVDVVAGVATVQVTPGISIGLAIALGGN